MAVSKLHLYDFLFENVSKAFFYNVCVSKTSCFCFFPCFYESYQKRGIIKSAIVYKIYPGEELICCCHGCMKEILSVTTIFGKEFSNNFFNDLKKILIQYFCVNR